MDILAQYDKQNPEPKQTPQSTYEDQQEDHGLITLWVIKIFRGKIKNVPQANAVLLGIMILGMIVSLYFFFFSGSSSAGKARFSTVCFPVKCPQQ